MDNSKINKDDDADFAGIIRQIEEAKGRFDSPEILKMFDYYIGQFSEIRDDIFKQYAKAGAPYGDTPGAVWKWWGELGEINKHKTRIQELMDNHELNAALRREGLSGGA